MQETRIYPVTKAGHRQWQQVDYNKSVLLDVPAHELPKIIATAVDLMSYAATTEVKIDAAADRKPRQK